MIEADDRIDDDVSGEPSGPRAPDDDFFCLRYRVWYRSRDCAIRTRFRTAPGCAGCDQGRFNARRHSAALLHVRWPLAAAD